jgi:low affinity Fe/Cu permease
MKILYRRTERMFEKLASVVASILGNSITFILALGTVMYWLTNKRFYSQDIQSAIGDIILGLTFLSLFIIQKSFVHFSASLHVKVNELVASHQPARNSVMNAEDKTEDEITELSKEYAELSKQIQDVKKENIPNRFHKKETADQK